ncbi:translation factor Sua5 [Rhizobium sp. Leaf371]|uniref:L-threonylcarbamoyladenylate synthase n=1 Tax=unclassified Rhizobium TaxID=2613769 RepID=UPI000715756A|nr:MULTISPECIES: L-threonylcarbamoyladenylate synthase [unclassified Rhizobium]KQS67791.1 translation factor Sua5 [Rhizobium sp. Leaf371]TCM55813.1 translation factor SUA5 [Rhizobium sp. PP-F2F-G48]
MAEIIDTTLDPARALDRAVAVLGQGRPIALPTETVYGLAADATRADAIASIYEVKGRPRFNPLISHVSDMAMAERHGAFDPVSRRLAEAFWPGPLTLVVARAPGSAVHALATAGLDTLGLRMPAGFAREVIAAFGQPLAAPSANTSGRISPTTAAHVADDLGGAIDLILDAGPAGIGLESTIVKMENGQLRLLRPGGLEADEIEAVAGQRLLRPAAAGAAMTAAGAALEAPGMLASHYAPAASVRLDATEVRPGEALIRFGGRALPGEDRAALVLDLSPSGSLREAAAHLFSYMKQADATGARTIAFSAMPADGLGEAIRDRLERAAAPR